MGTRSILGDVIVDFHTTVYFKKSHVLEVAQELVQVAVVKVVAAVVVLVVADARSGQGPFLLGLCLSEISASITFLSPCGCVGFAIWILDVGLDAGITVHLTTAGRAADHAEA